MDIPKYDIKKVLISDPIDPDCVSLLTAAGITVECKKGLKNPELIAALKDCDALIVRSGTTVTAEIIENSPSLKIIGRAGTGVDNIDCSAATKAGIIVMNTPGGNTISAAEHTFALMASLARKIPPAHTAFKAGKWDRKTFMGVELENKTLGILGLGRIGREVAKRAQAFGMKTVGYDPLLPKEVAQKHGIEFLSLEEIWPISDFLTVHTPLTEETRGLLGDASFAKCKDGVRVINCARGGIIDEDALLRALKSKKCAGAALDVFDSEPPADITNNELLQHPEVVITPHLGASTEEAQNKVAREIAQQIIAAAQGKPFGGVVNAPYIGVTLKPETAAWLKMSHSLGRLASQLMFSTDTGNEASAKLDHVTVTVSGEQIKSIATMLTNGVVSGLLSGLCANSVNLINASMMAEEMGINVNSVLSTSHPNYSNLLTVEYETDKKKRTYKATIFGKDNARLVQVDEYYTEIELEGTLLFLRNKDKPGVCAKIGGIIAESDVNLGFLSLGRAKGSDVALTIFGIDSEITPEALKKIQAVEWVLYAKMIKL